LGLLGLPFAEEYGARRRRAGSHAVMQAFAGCWCWRPFLSKPWCWVNGDSGCGGDVQKKALLGDRRRWPEAGFAHGERQARYDLTTS